MSCVLSSFFIMLLQLVFKSRCSEICSEAFGVNINTGEALAICTASSRTGHTILIDTSLVPRFITISCNCSVDIDASAKSVYILYKSIQESACGLRFKAADSLFQCDDMDVSLDFKTFTLLEFSKTTATVNADACFVLMIDRDAIDKSNATVTCFVNGGQTTTFVQKSAITTSDQITNQNLHTVSSITTRSSTTTASGLTLMTTSANEPITKLNTDGRVAVNDAPTEYIVEKSNIVVIAAAAGGGGVCLLMISLTLVYCYCRRMNKKGSNKPVYANTCTTNTALGAGFTENTVGDDKYHAVVDNTETHQTYALSSIENKSLDNDASFYNTIEDDKAVETKKGHIYMHLTTNVNSDPPYSSLELTRDTIAEGKTSSATQSNGRGKTYYNVNKIS